MPVRLVREITPILQLYGCDVKGTNEWLFKAHGFCCRHNELPLNLLKAIMHSWYVERSVMASPALVDLMGPHPPLDKMYDGGYKARNAAFKSRLAKKDVVLYVIDMFYSESGQR